MLPSCFVSVLCLLSLCGQICSTTVRAINCEDFLQRRPTKARAHLWPWVSYFATFERAGVSAQHTKAHASEADIANEKSTWWERAANNEADRLAKLGTEQHGLDAEATRECRTLSWLAAEFGRLLAATAAHVADKGVVDCVSFESLEKPALAAARDNEFCELKVGDFCAPRVVPPSSGI